MIFKLIQRREVVWLVGEGILRNVRCSVCAGCVNGMETATLRVICMAHAWCLCMKMSWRCVRRSMQIGSVVGMCGDNVA